MAGTQLYNKDRDPIYPVGIDEYISSSTIYGTTNVQEALSYLNDKVSTLSGDALAVTSIRVEIAYARTYISNQASIEVATSADGVNWTLNFQKPNAENPYTWKRTIFKVGTSTEKRSYEIVATTMQEKVQTLYLVTNVDKSEIKLPLVNASGDIENYNSWELKPQSINAYYPDLYITTRTMTDGKWGDFSTPAQYGKYARDSQLLIRYKLTNLEDSDTPTVNKQMLEPTGWSLKSPVNSNTTGKLWIITATAIGGSPTPYDGNEIWSDPNLISIIR